MHFLKRHAILLAWLLSLLAFFISIFLSEVEGWPVCHLCWYQRVCLYPQVIMLGLAAMREDAGVLDYLIPISFIGLVFSLVQYLLQQFPVVFSQIELCGAGPSCVVEHLNWLGFITLPFLSAVLFALLIILQWVGRLSKKL